MIPLVLPDVRWTLISDKCGSLRLGFLPRNSVICDRYPYVSAKDSDSHFDLRPFKVFWDSMSVKTAAANCADGPCWTCRRRRLKCDRALPICGKCTCSQQPCLGYSKDKPLRWTDSVATRGKLTGKKVPHQEQHLPISRVLDDPCLQDLSPSMRGYITYCKWSSRANQVLAD